MGLFFKNKEWDEWERVWWPAPTGDPKSESEEESKDQDVEIFLQRTRWPPPGEPGKFVLERYRKGDNRFRRCHVDYEVALDLLDAIADKAGVDPEDLGWCRLSFRKDNTVLVKPLNKTLSAQKLKDVRQRINELLGDE